MRRGLCHGLRPHLLVSWSIVRELVAALGRQSFCWLEELRVMTPIVGVVALAGLDGF